MSRTPRFARFVAARVLLPLFVCLLVTVAVAAQDKPVGTAGAMSAEAKAMMDAMEKAATPGANHETT
jgi:hypothetical protein